MVDGELDHEARDQVHAHLAHCAECRDAVDAERRVKSLLSGMPAPTASASLEAGLLALAEPAGVSGEESPRPLGSGASATRGDLARTPIQAGVRVPARAPRLGPSAAHRPPGQPGTRRPRRDSRPAGRSRRRLTVGVAGAAAMATMTFVVAFAAGGQPKEPAQVSVVPPVQRYAVDHAGSAAEVPLTDPGAATASFDRGLLAPTAGR
nr:zf-HC2 domain-containing protein [Actinopolymorpha cephalotaxi]